MTGAKQNILLWSAHRLTTAGHLTFSQYDLQAFARGRRMGEVEILDVAWSLVRRGLLEVTTRADKETFGRTVYSFSLTENGAIAMLDLPKEGFCK